MYIGMHGAYYAQFGYNLTFSFTRKNQGWAIFDNRNLNNPGMTKRAVPLVNSEW